MNRSGVHRSRVGFTIVEMLVVIFIIGLLSSLLLPAVNSARESGRTTVCINNLRQFGIGFHAQSDRLNDALCTGAFSWKYDGPVTEVGWVADMVNSGSITGQMLCPSNVAQICETYNDLLDMDPASVGSCVDLVGSEATTAPDGTTIANPCRVIVDTPLAEGSEDRRLLVEREVFEKGYNTNYTASWFLVRTEAVIDSSGNLVSSKAGCTASLYSRNSTRGPLQHAMADNSECSMSLIPMLGCGAISGTLSQAIGPHDANTLVTRAFTSGPAKNANMETPTFPAGHPREGGTGWWAVWTKQTFQDYRAFAPVHRDSCNVLFADGSVRSLTDTNGDGLLNNGFSAGPDNGFKDSTIEVTDLDICSRSFLREL